MSFHTANLEVYALSRPGTPVGETSRTRQKALANRGITYYFVEIERMNAHIHALPSAPNSRTAALRTALCGLTTKLLLHFDNEPDVPPMAWVDLFDDIKRFIDQTFDHSEVVKDNVTITEGEVCYCMRKAEFYTKCMEELAKVRYSLMTDNSLKYPKVETGRAVQRSQSFLEKLCRPVVNARKSSY